MVISSEPPPANGDRFIPSRGPSQIQLAPKDVRTQYAIGKVFIKVAGERQAAPPGINSLPVVHRPRPVLDTATAAHFLSVVGLLF